MLEPIFIFGFVVATLMGAFFHLIFGGNVRRFTLFLLASWIGFAIGHIGGETLDIAFFPIGKLRIVPAIIGALFTLFAALVFTSGRR